MSIRGKRRLASEINVVPYIDVMLVLLIIFMVTAPLLTTGVEVDLPDASAQVLDTEDNDPIVLSVTQDGQLYLNVGANPDQPLSSDEVTDIASRVIRERPDAPVAVRGDGSGSYGNVVRGMVMLQRAGASQVGLLTDNIDDSTSER
ncbi:protein TolR [Salinisphaera sp.]|uniref:protein TolR n=1 Tax=Salinisphaera sp. TaxID=1914330 RepID=UPI000C3ECBF7|nr:protein TolR [Salinisphaera sp.]MBS62642.1 protein TolR [Salinisphaera sp.]